jgi:acyl carrier protein phosphodiesterase
MNFLGHLLLSGDDPLVITGNFMADSVKGRDLSQYAEGLQHGIRLHRRIDTFTDQHPITLQGRERLRAHCGKYAGVALDLFYDHVIASEWSGLHRDPLAHFTQRMYSLLQANAHLMPVPTQRMLPYMVQGNWLLSYAQVHGLARALNGLSVRAPGGHVLAGAEAIMEQHADAFRSECLTFLRSIREELDK